MFGAALAQAMRQGPQAGAGGHDIVDQRHRPRGRPPQPKGPVQIGASLAGIQAPLISGIARPLHQILQTGSAQPAADQHGLVEAALTIAIAMQGHGDQRPGQPEPASRQRRHRQVGQQPPHGDVATILERPQAVIDPVPVLPQCMGALKRRWIADAAGACRSARAQGCATAPAGGGDPGQVLAATGAETAVGDRAVAEMAAAMEQSVESQAPVRGLTPSIDRMSWHDR